jgi:hypothetical protein
MIAKSLRLSILFVVTFCLFISNKIVANDLSGKYFATCSDSNYYYKLCNLIGSIHHTHSDDLGEIAVFNLGLLPEQINELDSMYKVKVYDIEMTNPDIFTYFRRCLKENYMVRGLYSFKPVVIKHALDLFPYVLYLDAGCLVLRPLDELFKHIQQNSYFLFGCGHSIRFMATNHVIEKFCLNSNDRKWILDETTPGISAGIQGLTRNLYDSYVMPIYNLSKDIRNFMDDGSTPPGLVVPRNDQTLFSIQAALLGLKIFAIDSPCLFDINNNKIHFYVNFGNPSIHTHILLQASKDNDFRGFIKHKNPS